MNLQTWANFDEMYDRPAAPARKKRKTRKAAKETPPPSELKHQNHAHSLL